MNEQSQSQKEEVRPSAFSRFVKKHPVFTTILCGLIVAVAVYFWKDVEGSIQRKVVAESANTYIQENNKVLLKLCCKPLVWSVRSEMLKGNMEQVNLLITDMVKEKHFLYIHLVDMKGFVVLSTNKKMEGEPIEDENIMGALAADSTIVITEPDHAITIVSPVMGYDRRLSTLVFSYLPETFDMEWLKKKTIQSGR